MLEIKKISAEDLVNTIELFETEEEEKAFVENAERKAATYSITVEVVGKEKYTDCAQNTIWEDVLNSSNEAFFNVELSKIDVENLKKVGNAQEI